MKQMYGTFMGLIILVLAQVALASPAQLTYQGRILKPDGSAFEYNQTRFNFQITGPAGPASSCVIYSETVTGIDMTNSGGVFDLSIGTSHSFPSDPTFSILDVFDNTKSFFCQGGSTTVPGYVASSGDGRKLRVSFWDGASWSTISPDQDIRTVPFAGYSASAEKLGSHPATDFTLKPSFASCGSGSFLTWDSTAGFTCTAGGGGGGGGSVSDSSYTTKGIVQFDTSAATSGMIYSSSGVAKVNVGTGANQIIALDSSGRMPAVDGSALTNVNAAKISGQTVTLSSPATGQVLQYNGSGFVNATLTDSDTFAALPCTDGYIPYKSGGAWTCLPVSTSTVNNSVVSRNGSGGFAASSADLNSVIVRDGSTAGTVTLSVPTGFTAYSLIFPSTAGTSGQVLAKGAGNNLQWTSVTDTLSGLGCTIGQTAVYNGSVWTCATAFTNSLTSANIFIGNASNVATGVVMSGDASIVASGAVTVSALKGKALDTTAPSVDGQLYAWDTTSSKWKITTATAPTNGQVLSWNSTTKTWQPSTAASGTDTLGGLSCTSGQTAIYNGSAWVCGSAASNSLTSANFFVGNASNVATGVAMSGDASLASSGAVTVAGWNGKALDTTAPSVAGQIYVWDATASKWKVTTASAPTNGQAMLWNSTSKSWEPGTVATGTDTLGGLSCANGQIPEYNGTAWVCANTFSNLLPTADFFVGNGSGVAVGVAMSGDTTLASTGAVTVNALKGKTLDTTAPSVDGQLYSWDTTSSKWKMTTATAPTSGQVLSWNSTTKTWQPSTVASGTDTLGGLSCTTGQTAIYNGTAWVCQDTNTLNSNNSLVMRNGSGISEFAGVALKNSGTSVTLAAGTGSTYTLTLPTALPASNGMVLSSTTAGVTSWTTTSADTLGALSCVNGQIAEYNGSAWVCANTFANSLTTANFFVGNASNAAVGVAMSGDASLAATGAVTVNALKGKALDTTAPSVDGQLYSWDTTSSKWKMTTATAPTNGQVLSWNSTTKTWQPSTVATGTDTLGGLSCANGQIAEYNGTAWVCANSFSSTLTSANIFVGNASNVATGVAMSGDASIVSSGAVTVSGWNGNVLDTTAPTVDGQLYSWDTTSSKWKMTTAAAPTNGQVLSWNSTTKTWQPSTVASGTDTLGGLSCTSGQTAIYNGTAWVCQDTNTMNSNNSLVMRNGSGISEFAGVALKNSGTSVTMAAAAAGSTYTLTWPNALPASNGMVLTSTTAGLMSWTTPTDTLSGLSCSSGQAAVYNGSAWACQSVSSTSLASAKIFVGNSSGVASAVSMSGDATISNTGALTIANSAITNAKVSSTAAIARSKLASGTANGLVINDSSGVMTDMTCSTANQVPTWSGSAWTCTTPLTALPTLASAKMWIGNASSVATAVSMSGDATITNAGAITVTKINGTAPTTTGTSSAVLQLDASGLANDYGENIKGTTAGQVQLRAPASLTTYTLTLPTTAGTNGQYLQTNGSGTLSWASVSTGAVAVKSTDFSVATTENNYTYIVNGVANATLPAAASAGSGFQITVKNTSGGTVAIVAQAGEYIDGGAQANLTSTNAYVKLITDGTGWYIVSGTASITPLTCTSGSQTFAYTGGDQTLSVSAAQAIACHYAISIKGAGGGGTIGGTGGGVSISTLKLSAAGTFTVRVGGKGLPASSNGTGGWYGGGTGGTSSFGSCGVTNGGGGGASAVEFGSTVYAVAGGGGGGGYTTGYAGGNGGGVSAATAASGTQAGGAGAANVGGSAGGGSFSGGAGSGSGSAANLLIAAGGSTYAVSMCEGGGGSGYGGGGGGGGNGSNGGGGGGGGGYVNSTAITSGSATAADQSGSAAGTDGTVTITWN